MSSSRDVLGCLILILLLARSSDAWAGPETAPLDAPASFPSTLGGAAAGSLGFALFGLTGGAGVGLVLGGDGTWSDLDASSGGMIGMVVGGVIGAAVGAHQVNGQRGSAALVGGAVLALSAALAFQLHDADGTEPWLLLIPAAVVAAPAAELLSTPRRPRMRAALWRPERGPAGAAVHVRF
ncbi:MAG TPA: hypothetical protein P5571_04215 [Candidatus Krumholzibacteria bacterium]|nr:hypothetical protein [Candidatus Krumholzibacteria bacterium]HRX50544.1 hypothetical protein [Candidatus Krumholzibacteria bacterium]